MNSPDTMDLPIRMFWTLNKYISRLQAEEDLRLLPLMRASTKTEGFKETLEVLKQERGDVAKVPPVLEKLDREGLNALRGKG